MRGRGGEGGRMRFHKRSVCYQHDRYRCPSNSQKEKLNCLQGPGWGVDCRERRVGGEWQGGDGGQGGMVGQFQTLAGLTVSRASQQLQRRAREQQFRYFQIKLQQYKALLNFKQTFQFRKRFSGKPTQLQCPMATLLITYLFQSHFKNLCFSFGYLVE